MRLSQINPKKKEFQIAHNMKFEYDGNYINQIEEFEIFKQSILKMKELQVIKVLCILNFDEIEILHLNVTLLTFIRFMTLFDGFASFIKRL